MLLGWALVNAALGDYYSPRTHQSAAIGLALLNLVALGTRLIQGPVSTKLMVINLGVFGGFTLLEMTLILNSFLTVGLLYARLSHIPAKARPLLYLVTLMFVIGALLATASNQRVDFQILAWHATWHIVGAFGFIVLWAFNHMRFVMSETWLETISIENITRPQVRDSIFDHSGDSDCGRNAVRADRQDIG